MDSNDMLKRTRDFALRIIKLVGVLPHERIGDVIGRQVLRSGTSIGANYREAIRASSKKQFVSILEIVQRETEETIYWLELIGDAKLIRADRLSGLYSECRELMAIVTSTIRSAKLSMRKQRSN